MTKSKSDPFYSPKQRLSRAKSHIDRLEARIGGFFKKKPYTTLVDPDPGGIQYTHKIKFTRDIPDIFSTVASEALEGLRSTLDQIGYAVAVSAGKVTPKNCYFPIADTAPDLENVVKGRCKDLPDEIRTLFRSFEAHKGGNFPIWALNKLRQSVHTKLIPIGIVTGGMEVRSMTVGGSGTMEMFAPVFDASKNEIAYMRSTVGAKLQYQMRFSFNVGFGEIDDIKTVPATQVLRVMMGEVRKVLLATEAESLKIGITR